MQKALLIFFTMLFSSGMLLSLDSNEQPEFVVNIKTDEEIHQAMSEIKAEDIESYKNLKDLQIKNDPQFHSRLHNRYYALKHKERLEKKIAVRERGYREKSKESDQALKELKNSYEKASSETEKKNIESKIKLEAEKRYSIELEHKKKQISRLNELLLREQNKLNDFENQKDKYVSRLITKIKALGGKAK